ncbi:MAG TPA: tetratricopeptide repeat protein [Candidatus Saccharimonadales bacterium]|nr:tetratricopeptide repeat protein [Candidatus Saccharimonadales bacterium]
MEMIDKLIKNYCYTDMQTWETIKNNIQDINTLVWCVDDLIKHPIYQDVLAILVSYHIHQLPYVDSIDKIDIMLSDLLTLKTQERYPLFLYLNAKYLCIKKEYEKSLFYFHQAKEEMYPCHQGYHKELRSILIAIGSITQNDPQDIETNILKAIIANDLGNLYIVLHLYHLAIDEFQNALSLQKSTYQTKNHANIVYTLTCLGHAQEIIGDLKSAESNYQDALAMAKMVYTDNHPELVPIMSGLLRCNQLKQINHEQWDYDDFILYYTKMIKKI